ncbi:MAG TPA: BON domain-containing protein [Chloroflexota bacterium]|nr:BON domain-containing protein [Chloroflexota bacterium]
MVHVNLPWEQRRSRMPEFSLSMPRMETPNWRRMRDWRPDPDVWQLLAAFALGAAVMYLLDPDMGKRRRNMAVDRTAGVTRRAARGMGRAGRKIGTDMAGKRQALLHGQHDGREPLDDATLAHKVESVLFRDPDVPKGSLNINAEHGVVVIRGEVRTPDQIRDIEQRVERIDGVQEVRSMLHLVNKSASSS